MNKRLELWRELRKNFTFRICLGIVWSNRCEILRDPDELLDWAHALTEGAYI